MHTERDCPITVCEAFALERLPTQVLGGHVDPGVQMHQGPSEVNLHRDDSDTEELVDNVAGDDVLVALELDLAGEALTVVHYRSYGSR